MHAILFLSHLLLAIAIKQIHIRVIAFVYLECKQISSSKSDQPCTDINTLFIIRTELHKIIYPDYLYLKNC